MSPVHRALPVAAPRRPRGGRAALLAPGLAIAVLAGCSAGSDAADAPSTATAPASTTSSTGASPSPTSTDPPATPDDRSSSRTILDGWVSYAPPEGWEVVIEADGLRAVRDDLDAAPTVPRIGTLETLLEVRDPRSGARVVLMRERAFLDAPDVDAWTDTLAEDLDGDRVADEPIDLAHGPGRRLVHERPEGIVGLATTAFADQRVALLFELPTGLDGRAQREVDALVTSVVLDPEIVLAPLLHHHAGLVRHETAGAPTVELAIQVPSDWSAIEVPEGIRYEGPDGTASAEVTFAAAPATSADDAMADLLDERGRDDLLDGTERDLAGTPFRVARFGPGELQDGDLGTEWLLQAETPAGLVIVRLDDTDAGADDDADAELLLLRRMIDTIALRAE